MLSERLQNRFWGFVAVGDGCWEWTGNRLQSGYGRISNGQFPFKCLRAHRVAYEIWFGPIPDDILVCHTCDNRGCVNPSHLFLGNHADNHADRNAKQRQARGERINTAQLTEEEAQDVIALYSDGVSRPFLAESFGVNWGTIDAVVIGESWKHLSRPYKIGEKQKYVKLKESDVREIVKKYSEGVSRTKLAEIFGVSWNAINNVVKCKSWKHLR